MSNRVSRHRLPLAQLLAMAALAAMGSAQAQSSVQAYGLIDMSAGQFQAAGGTKDKAVQSGNMSTSYLGFKGTEDLGGGLKANFAMESFLRADSGASGRFGTTDSFWARNAYVGLAGDFGGLTLGRNTTSLFVSTLIFNAFGDSFGYSPSIRHYYQGGVGVLTGDSGWNQSISYSTPNMGGLSAQLQVAGDSTNAGGFNTNGRKFGGNVLYFSGSFAGTVAYQKVKPGTAKGTTATQVGASYDLGGAKLYGQYGKVTVDDGSSLSYKLSEVGVAVPVGAGKFLLEYGRLSDVSRTTITGGYDYTLSKRTDAYAVVMSDKKTSTNTGSTYAVGVRHKF